MMRVTYTSPNRSHHYRYASALAAAGCLHCFVSGFSRFSARAALSEMNGKLLRADELQNLYLASLRLRFPAPISDELAYLSKQWLDLRSEKPARASDIFFFYSGAGLRTEKRLRGSGVKRVVEAVNSHVQVQEEIMQDEHRRLEIPPPRFHPREVARRVAEYENADAVICPSQFVKRSFVQKKFPEDRIHVVPFGIELGQERPIHPKSSNVFRVLYVGQISPRKGLRYLFEAFDLLKHPQKELWIVGPKAKVTGLENVTPPQQTRFTGVLKGEELARAYQSASVFVLPTVEEGLALVLGEAFSHGLPVITTENSGGEDLFTDGTEGFLVPIRDSAVMAEKMQQLADEPDRRARMSAAALARARAIGGWDDTGRTLVATLEKIAAQGAN